MNSLQIWPVNSRKEDERFVVSHSEEITCFELTYDAKHVITGSKDMSLKVWEVHGGKLAQVCRVYLHSIYTIHTIFGGWSRE